MSSANDSDNGTEVTQNQMKNSQKEPKI